MNTLTKNTAKTLLAVLAVSGMMMSANSYADNCCPPETGRIHGKSVLAAVLSTLVWPGIGQAVNDNQGKKVGAHAVLGLLPPYRLWSGYDALVDRQGGYWNGKI